MSETKDTFEYKGRRFLMMQVHPVEIEPNSPTESPHCASCSRYKLYSPLEVHCVQMSLAARKALKLDCNPGSECARVYIEDTPEEIARALLTRFR